MKKFFSTLTFIFTSFGLTGCVTAPPGSVIVNNASDVMTIQAAYAKQLDRVHTGMTISNFKKLLPKAYLAGQYVNTTAYQLDYNKAYVTKEQIARMNLWVGFGSPYSTEIRQELWFYFYKNRLIKWGKPGDWPSNPRIILEEIIKNEK